jgi:hypothetical protein
MSIVGIIPVIIRVVTIVIPVRILVIIRMAVSAVFPVISAVIGLFLFSLNPGMR